MIKAIETEYKGYRFRSRLEARWAVFFDSVGIEWQYEVEGYELDDLRYLPDFYLPQANMWLEVKPVAFTPDEREKASRLSKATHRDVILAVGVPEPTVYLSIREEGRILMPYKDSIWMSEKIQMDYPDTPFEQWLIEDKERCVEFARIFSSLMAACRAARSARFEHGEKGA